MLLNCPDIYVGDHINPKCIGFSPILSNNVAKANRFFLFIPRPEGRGNLM